MSYQPLARKYRPRKFSDLVGQDAVALALSNAIKLKREPTAVIFSGVRGIGKTTTARLYAKALNCETGPTAEPCDACASCLAINRGTHEDVLEIDGASHNGVDEVRALQETVAYMPQRSPFKVYLIDEVHMLSTSAFNALLKTLEEPPPQVVFIFATTELQKVPQTVVGRCQTFYLQKLSLADTVARLRQILIAEGLEFEEAALQLVAKEGRGSMRDALTFLDQVIALGEGQVSVAAMGPLVATLAGEHFIALLQALCERDAKKCLAAVAAIDQAGLDFSEASEEAARLARHAFILREIGKEALDLALLALTESELTKLQTLAQSAAPFDLNRIFRTLVACKQDLDGSALDRFVLENYCLEWCLDPGFPSYDELMGFLAGSGAPSSPPARSDSRSGGRRSEARDPGRQTEGVLQPAGAAPSLNHEPSPTPQAPAAGAERSPDKPRLSLTETLLASRAGASNKPPAMRPEAREPQIAPGPRSDARRPAPASVPQPSMSLTAEFLARRSAPSERQLAVSEPQHVVPNPEQRTQAAGAIDAAVALPAVPPHLAPGVGSGSEPAARQPQAAQPAQPASQKQPPQKHSQPAHSQPAHSQPAHSQPAQQQSSSQQTTPMRQGAQAHLLPESPAPTRPPPRSLSLSPSRQPSEEAPGFGEEQRESLVSQGKPVVPLVVQDVAEEEEALVAVVDTASGWEHVQPVEFPDTWRGMVEAWKKNKPLEARVLEEFHLLAYSRERIVVAVRDEGMAVAALTQKANQLQIAAAMKQYFGFAGEFQVVSHTEANPESLLEIKERERADKRRALEEGARDHPLTQALVSNLGGSILKIKVKD